MRSLLLLAIALLSTSVLAQHQPAPPSNSRWQVYLQNDCNEPATFAVKFQDEEGRWRTRGWWVVPSRVLQPTDIYTKNLWVYFFASSKSHRWNGKEGTKFASRGLVREGAVFDHQDGYNYENTRAEIFNGELRAAQGDRVVVRIHCGDAPVQSHPAQPPPPQNAGFQCHEFLVGKGYAASVAKTNCQGLLVHEFQCLRHLIGKGYAASVAKTNCTGLSLGGIQCLRSMVDKGYAAGAAKTSCSGY